MHDAVSKTIYNVDNHGKDTKQLWIAGKITSALSDAWDFIGVFDKEELALIGLKEAVEAEKKRDGSVALERYFIGPAILNFTIIAADSSDWEGGYFPFENKNSI